MDKMMNVFNTHIPEAIASGLLDEQNMSIKDDPDLTLGRKKRFNMNPFLPSSLRENYVEDPEKLREKMTNRKPASPEEERIIKANMEYFANIGKISQKLTKEQVREQVKKVRESIEPSLNKNHNA